MRRTLHFWLAATVLATACPSVRAGEPSDPLARLQALHHIQDWPAVEKDARALLKTPLSPPQRVALYKALFDATEGDARLAVLKELPADFPEDEGIKLHVRAIQDSQAYRSLDFYQAMAERYPAKLTPEVVDKAARPLLNERRDWEAGAEAVVQAALKRFPGHPKLLDIQADVCRRTLREKESLDLQRQAVANATTPELKKEMYDRLIRNLSLQRKTDEALQVQRQVIEEWPDHDWARGALDALALHQLRATGVEKALEVCDAYVQAHPQGKWVEHCHLRRPFLFQLVGQYDRGAEEMKRILPLVSPRVMETLKRDLAKLPSLSGQVLDARGKPVPGATVVLARPSPIREERHLILARTQADGDGRFRFANLPHHERYEFLAATKPDNPLTGLSTTFGPQGIQIELGEQKTCDIRFGRPPLKRLPDPSPPEAQFEDGVARRLLRAFVLRDWTDVAWPRSPLHYPVELPRRVAASSLRLVDLQGRPVPFQFDPRGPRNGTLTFFASLPANGSAAFFLFGAEAETKPAEAETKFQVRRASSLEQEVSTGPAAFRVPALRQDRFSPPGHIQARMPPILAVKGPDGVWRGKGSFVGRGGVCAFDSQWVRTGPLWRELRLAYQFEGGGRYEATLSFLSGEPYVLVSEESSGLPVEFRFSAYPAFEPDRAAVCGINKLRVEAIAATRQRRLLEMPRYVMWAPPSEGDAVGFFRSAPDQKDLITTFTVQPGNWIVQSAERWRAETLGDKSRYRGDPKAGGRETIDAFEAEHDAYFSYHLFAGERQWGLAATDDENAVNRAADLRAYVGECTLDWYKDLVLDWDEEPPESHPRLVVARGRLTEVARALQTSPLLKQLFEAQRVQWFQSLIVERPDAGIEFLLTGDPERAWAARNVAPNMDRVRGARIGKMRANAYSPVGVRGCPYSSADAYDAVVNANLLDPATQRVVRARMMFLAYALMGPNFMAWRYHAGHRNFDFSRLDVIVAYGLLFPTHPDARKMVEHCTNQLRESIQAFTTEGSGKWQENLGCYYLWSLRTVAAMNARLLNARWRRSDPFDWPKYPQFLMFGVKCITPEHPLDDRLCIDGLKEGQSYDQVAKGRRIPGVGDHGGEGGTPVTDGIGLCGILAARQGYRRLATDLLAAWRAGGYMRDSQAGIDIKGHLAANLDPSALRLLERATLTPRASEHLPEYGFAFRADWGTPRETLLLFKCGKGGYRYHFSEGSFVLYANNRPLSLDGDENFIPARHATISVGPQCGYVGNGAVERHFLHPAADYCRGVYHQSKVTRSILFAKNDYFVIRDDCAADEPTNFHLPLLAHKIERRGVHLDSPDPDHRTPITDSPFFFCPGRLGTDILLYPLGPPPAKTDIKTDPLLNQQLLTMTRPKGQGHLNLLTWADPGAPPLKITPVGPGYRIEGRDFVDHLFFSPEPVRYQDAQIAFEGRVGLIRQRAGRVTLLLLDGTRIALGTRDLRSRDGQPCAR